jgi:hypothetical protein
MALCATAFVSKLKTFAVTGALTRTPGQVFKLEIPIENYVSERKSSKAHDVGDTRFV